MANQTGTDGDAIENAVLASANLEPEKRASAPGALLEGVETLHDSVFDKLVHQEEDVIGLLAYSLSMQNKRDWLTAFKQELGRDPNAAELAAYDIGERIERRLATYRKLAEHALSGSAFWASATLTPVSELPGAPAAEPSRPVASAAPPSRPSRFGSSTLAVVAGLIIVVAVAAYASRHYWGA
jgi:hypothetical protein